MPTVVDDAICVRHWDFSETSQTVSLFCREHGLLRGLAKGAKRERGRFSGGIDLLTRGQVVAIVKPGRELATLTDWDLQQTFRWLREDLDANRAAFYMVELLLRLITDGDPHPRVFDALISSLEMARFPSAIDQALLRYQWLLLEETGYRPRLDIPGSAETRPARRAVAPSGPSESADHKEAPAPAQDDDGTTAEPPTILFSAAEGGVVEPGPTPVRGWRVRVETIELLERVAAGEAFEDAPPAQIARATRLLAAYLRELIGEEPATMRALFGRLPPPSM